MKKYPLLKKNVDDAIIMSENTLSTLFWDTGAQPVMWRLTPPPPINITDLGLYF